MKQIFFIFFLFSTITGFCQIGISANGSTPDSSALLDVIATNKGFLPPRMTTAQREAIPSPAEGLIIYNLDDKTINVFVGTGWRPPSPIVCGKPFVDTRDGNSYKTVLIGAQCWMAQNLNVGTKISLATSQTDNGTFEKYCYNNDDARCAVYGGLYQWNEMMNYTISSPINPSGVQGICPTGWHLPSDAEWCQLETFLDASVDCNINGLIGFDVGGQLKEADTIHWAIPNFGATNASGFTALPGGIRSGGGTTTNLKTDGYFWSAMESSTMLAWGRAVSYNLRQVFRADNNKNLGMSCRCVRD